MASTGLNVLDNPRLTEGRMLLAFEGWMDGGDVSTGSVEWLVDEMDTRRIAEIDPEGFYIYNFPGSMELSALFRPHVDIRDGHLDSLEYPENTFFLQPESDLIVFKGKEPNLNWRTFADAIFSFAATCGVTTLYFVGSFGGLVPHTREPRLVTTVSDEHLREVVLQLGFEPANYEGPGSFSTYLMSRAGDQGLRMASLVAEIPSYIEGTNPKCIEAMLRKVSALLGLQLNLDSYRRVTETWERRLNEALDEKPELAEHIHKLEEDYDNEVFDTQMSDLKAWLERQGLRVD